MSYPLGWSTRLTAEPVTMAGSFLLAVLAMAELTPALDTVLELLRSPLGAVLFVPLYALWVTLLLPGVWASMLAGVLYGTWGGSALVFLGACLGAVATFLLGRHWLHDWASQRLASRGLGKRPGRGTRPDRHRPRRVAARRGCDGREL